jgi:hypothetical protein
VLSLLRRWVYDSNNFGGTHMDVVLNSEHVIRSIEEFPIGSKGSKLSLEEVRANVAHADLAIRAFRVTMYDSEGNYRQRWYRSTERQAMDLVDSLCLDHEYYCAGE